MLYMKRIVPISWLELKRAEETQTDCQKKSDEYFKRIGKTSLYATRDLSNLVSLTFLLKLRSCDGDCLFVNFLFEAKYYIAKVRPAKWLIGRSQIRVWLSVGFSRLVLLIISIKSLLLPDKSFKFYLRLFFKEGKLLILNVWYFLLPCLVGLLGFLLDNCFVWPELSL